MPSDTRRRHKATKPTTRRRKGKFAAARQRSLLGRVPDGFAVRTSRFLRRKGCPGRGLFTTAPLQPGDVIGQYRGRVIDEPTADRKVRGRSYLFEVRRRGKVVHVIDGGQWRHSSFVRFANAADWEYEQNCKFVQHNGEIFLVATSAVAAGAELLTWYGKNTQGVIASR